MKESRIKSTIWARFWYDLDKFVTLFMRLTSRVSRILCPVSNRAWKGEYLGNRAGRCVYGHMMADAKIRSNLFIGLEDLEQEYVELVQVMIVAM